MSRRPVAVPVHVVQDHLRPFVDAGHTHITLGHAAGVSPATVNNVLQGNHAKVKAGTAGVLLSLTHARVMATALQLGKPVPAAGTTRRLRALYHQGWNCYRIGEATGLGVASLRRHLLGEHLVVPAATHKAVAAYFAAHWDKTPTPGTHHHAGQIERARRTAAREGWPVALAWDDIDDPTQTPWEQEPATGGRPTDLGVDDLEFLIRNGYHSWTTLLARTGKSRETLRTRLRRSGRHDLLRTLDISEEGAA